MLAYFIVFFMLIIVPKFFNKKRTNTICFFILFIFSAIRFDIGWDFRWYYTLANKFDYIKYDLFINQNEVMKIGSQQFWIYYRLEFLNKILYKVVWLLKNPQLIIFFYSFIILYFLKKGLDYKKNYNYNTWLFFYTFPLFYLASLSIMRQWCAVAIIFFSYKYIEEKFFIKFLLCIFIASLFHQTAILLTPIYFFQYIKLNKKIYVLIFFISFFSLNILKKIFLLDLGILSKYRSYVLYKIGEGGKVIYFLIILLYLGILLLIYLDNKFYIKNEIIIKYICLGAFIYISLIDLGHLAYRMSQYFLIFILYIFDEIECILKKLKIKKYILIIEFILLFTFLNANKNHVIRSEFIPYKVFFINKNEGFLKNE